MSVLWVMIWGNCRFRPFWANIKSAENLSAGKGAGQEESGRSGVFWSWDCKLLFSHSLHYKSSIQAYVPYIMAFLYTRNATRYKACSMLIVNNKKVENWTILIWAENWAWAENSEKCKVHQSEQCCQIWNWPAAEILSSEFHTFTFSLYFQLFVKFLTFA